MSLKRAVIRGNAANVKRKRAKRAVGTPKQRENLEQVRSRATTARDAETPQQHENGLETDQLRTVQSRQKIDFKLAAFNYDKNCNYSNHPNIVIRPMSIHCLYYHVPKFKKESPSICCSNGKIK